MNREELAWAAGFFEGEGSLFIRSTGRPCMSIGQTVQERLIRFQEAVGSGSVSPGRRSSYPGGKDWWQFRTSRFESIQAIIAMLWEFWGPSMRERARSVLDGTYVNRYQRSA